MMDYQCGKFGDCTFELFRFYRADNRHTRKQTRIACLTNLIFSSLKPGFHSNARNVCVA